MWVGCLVAQHVDEHRGEAVDRVGVLAGGGREVLDRQREERAVGQRVAVEQEQAWVGRGSRARSPAHPSRAPPTPTPVGDNAAMSDPMPIEDCLAQMPQRHGRAQREDGHRARRGLRRAGRRHDAGRGQHPALRAAARRRVGGPRRDARARSASAVHAQPDRISVGVDINATHHRAATSGHGHRRRHRRCTSGRTMATYEVVITDEARQAGLHVADHLRAGRRRTGSRLSSVLGGWVRRSERRAASTWPTGRPPGRAGLAGQLRGELGAHGVASPRPGARPAGRARAGP